MVSYNNHGKPPISLAQLRVLRRAIKQNITESIVRECGSNTFGIYGLIKRGLMTPAKRWWSWKITCSGKHLVKNYRDAVK